MTDFRRTVALGATALALLAGCATVPSGPAVNALPGSRKTAEQYFADDAACRARAQAIFGPTSAQPANEVAAANVVGGTLVGAAVGALIGAAFGDAGTGAAIGAGTGLLGGSAAAANVSGYSTMQLQALYDREYLQCMFARGHQVPGRTVAFRPAPSASGYVPPSTPPAAGFPPRDTPPPPGVGGPQGYAPPSNVAPAAGFPPRNAPPPPGTGVPPQGYAPPSTVAPPGGYPPANTPPPPPRG
jgi:hypothetical protein